MTDSELWFLFIFCRVTPIVCIMACAFLVLFTIVYIVIYNIDRKRLLKPAKKFPQSSCPLRDLDDDEKGDEL